MNPVILDPVGISNEAKAIIFFIKAAIAIIVFLFFLFGLTVHIYKKMIPMDRKKISPGKIYHRHRVDFI